MARTLRWLLVVPIVVAIAITGCGSDKTVPGGGGGGRTFVGAKVCKGCHVETGQHWDGTKHAEALKTLTDIGMGTNANCVPCHTVGYGQTSGYINQTETPDLANVQCENCHGAGSAHAANPTSAAFSREVTSAACGTCHTDAHHPTYDEWQNSAHARSVVDGHQDKCMACHSQEGFFYQLSQPIMPVGEHKSKVVVGSTNIGCPTCHDPHEATANTAQLRLEKKALCETCHRLSAASVTDAIPITGTPRHGASLIFEGKGAYTPNGKISGTAMSGPNSAHTTAAAEGCATCHLFKVNVPSPNTDNPNVTGHTFEPNLKACTQSGCHTPSGTTVPRGKEAIESGADVVAVNLMETTQAEFTAKLNQVKPYVTTGNALFIDRNTLTGPNLNDYDVAKWNYNLISINDPSKGVHNHDYSLAVLNSALATFQRLSAP
ncbi:MAG: hypothetical protein HZB16_13190 [Armatimonadetes bacterium]|nr:hypothetical protein [Armatimonadota bacterium]